MKRIALSLIILLILIFPAESYPYEDLSDDRHWTPMADITDIVEKSGNFDYHLTFLDPAPFLADYQKKLRLNSENQLVSVTDSVRSVSVYLPDSSLLEMTEKAKKLLSEGRTDEAAELIEKIKKADPEFWKTDTMTGQLQLIRGNFTKGLESLQSAIEKNPADWEAHLLKGRCLEELGEFEKAKQSYILAIICNRNFRESWDRLENLGKKARFTLRREPFIPLYTIEKMPNGKTRIYLDKDTVYRWMPYAFNKAVFSHQPGYFEKRTGEKEYRRTFTEEMESVRNTLWSYRAFRLRGSIPKDPVIERLSAIHKRMFLKQFILFEILSPEEPEILVTLNKSDMLDMIDYINEFIITDAGGNNQ